MIKVKGFETAISVEELEYRINKWLEANYKCDIINIGYSTTYHDNGHRLHYTALITYNSDEIDLPEI